MSACRYIFQALGSRNVSEISCRDRGQDGCRLSCWDNPCGEGKGSPLQYPSLGNHMFDPWVGKIPWRRKRRPTPVFLPGEFHGQRSLAGYSPWGCKELDTTEWLSLYFTSVSFGQAFHLCDWFVSLWSSACTLGPDLCGPAQGCSRCSSGGRGCDPAPWDDVHKLCVLGFTKNVGKLSCFSSIAEFHGLSPDFPEREPM